MATLCPSFPSAALMCSGGAHPVFCSERTIGHAGLSVLLQKVADAISEFMFALLASLDKLRNPSAVVGAVVPIVVDSIERRSFRPVAHVCKKQLVAIPSFADRNSSSTIPVPFIAFWVIAPLSHLLPRAIRSGFVRQAVRFVHLCGNVFSVAPAGLRFAGSQLEGIDNRSPAAVASTYPQSSNAANSSGFFQHGQATKSLPDKVNCGHKNAHEIEGTETVTLYHARMRSLDKIKGVSR